MSLQRGKAAWGTASPCLLKARSTQQLALRTAYEDMLRRASPFRVVCSFLTGERTCRATQVSGFWLRGESLANLALLAQPCGPPLLQVHRGVHVSDTWTIFL